MTRMYLLLAGTLALSACAGSFDGGIGSARNAELTEEVRALAAPGQDLTTARLRPDDNCYWYDHAGPVETTPLPLRSVDGSKICASSPA